MARIAKSLAVLREQANQIAPQRLKSSDGWIGDEAHAARVSDHNPNADGVVTALDITHDPFRSMDTYALAEQLLRSRDERIKYVISNRKIASGTGQGNPAWVWRTYSGSNPHDSHIHISVKGEPVLADDETLWNITAMPPANGPPVIDKPILRRGSRGEDVRELQRLVLVDGIYGATTEAAVKAFQRARGLDDDGIVGPYTWRALLGPEPTPELWHENVKATTWGGNAEEEYSGYDNKRITETELAASLPYRFPSTPPSLEVRNRDTGAVVTVPVRDIGPWNTNDAAYVLGNARPQAESGTDTRGRTTNSAGIDLSPAAVRALGFKYSSAWSGAVDWRIKPNPATEAARIAAIIPQEAKAMAMSAQVEAVVPVESAWYSKINWTQIVGVGASLLVVTTGGAVNIPAETQVALVTAIQGLQAVATWAFRTFFNATVTPSSVK